MSSIKTTRTDDSGQADHSESNGSSREAHHEVAAEAARRQARQDPLQG